MFRWSFVVLMSPPGMMKSAFRPMKKSRRTMDDILGDIMNESMKRKDKGEKVDMEFVYKQAQQRMYEAEFGSKPPSMNGNYKAHIPYLPDKDPSRLVPLDLFEDDPWPRRSFHHPAEDQFGNRVRPLTDDEKEDLDAEDVHRTAAEAAADALDEMSYWEVKYLDFL